MAKQVLTDAYLSVNSVDLSDHVESLTLNYEAENQDGTAMGDGTRINYGGLKNWSLDVNWRQDFAASKVDATLYSIVGTQVAIEVRAVNTTVSSTNPKFTGTGLIKSYSPVAGAVGDMHNAPTGIMCAGTLTRGTSP